MHKCRYTPSKPFWTLTLAESQISHCKTCERLKHDILRPSVASGCLVKWASCSKLKSTLSWAWEGKAVPLFSKAFFKPKMNAEPSRGHNYVGIVPLNMYLFDYFHCSWVKSKAQVTKGSFLHQPHQTSGIHAFLGWPTSLGRIEWWCLVSKWWQTHPWDLFLHLMRGVGEGIRVAKGGVCLSGFATVKS